MDTLQIDHVLKNHPATKDYFEGVFALDEIPRVLTKNKYCYIFNSDTRDKPGSHWLAFYYNGSRGEFFDSYGNSPSFYSQDFKEFLDKHIKTWDFNTKRFQGTFSTVCGQYCIYYLIKRCEGKGLRNVANVFSHDLNKNDRKVNTWFNQKYNSSFPTHDLKFTLSQIAQSFEYREVNA